MDSAKPVQYAPYARIDLDGSSSEQIRSLAKGYNLFELSTLVFYLTFFSSKWILPKAGIALIFVLSFPTVLALGGVAVKHIGHGMGWTHSKIVWVRIALAINWVFGGVFGLLILPRIVKKRLSIFGLRLKYCIYFDRDVEEQIALLENSSALRTAPKG